MDMRSLASGLIVLGLLLVAGGVLLHYGGGIPFLGKLPGDIRIDRPGVKVYLPVTTCIVISLILSLICYIVSRLR